MKESIIPLPKEVENRIDFDYFPTMMQAVIFKNWDIVPKERIALCLDTDVSNIEKQAEKMGLSEQEDVSLWLERGYISIIKVNWHLLSYEQLMVLLGWDAERLAFVLKEEDFLDIKLGEVKPKCPKILYRELTEAEEKKTEKIKALILENFDVENKGKKAFDFYPEECISNNTESPDCSWAISDETNDENVGYMKKRFIRDIKNKWNIDLESKSADKKIILRLFSEKKEEEYHEINIGGENITITSADSAGILRGLVYLKELAEVSGGFNFEKKTYKRRAKFKTRFIYPFSGLYNEAFDVDSTTYCPDDILEKYSETGINGIWLQAVLYKMTEFPFEPSLSLGWEKRIENLKSFIKRAARFGIKIYLYFNEPRFMYLNFFEKYPELLGNTYGDKGCLCTSTQPVQEYLKNGINTVVKTAEGLGGIFVISRSENVTNCYSHGLDTKCPRCSKRKHYEILAEVNKLIYEGAKDANPDIKVFAWNWGWLIDEGFMVPDDVEKCIELMPKDIIILSCRETDLPTNVGGVKSEVNDYSISVCGVSELARHAWRNAKKFGHETAAKLQINNSWECSTIPYIPVFSLLTDDVCALAKEGVEHLMLSWTLGGYPSANIKIVSELFFEDVEEEKEPDYERIFKTLYGENAENVKKASDAFGEAFKEYPFNIFAIYYGPSNGGASNLLYLKPTGLKAGMTGYPYDDLERWRSVYPEEILEQQFGLLSQKWEAGMRYFDNVADCEIKDMSKAVSIQFSASYNQISFVRARNRYLEDKNEEDRLRMLEILKDEAELAKELYGIMKRNPCVGFEAANHYYYTKGMLMEKVVNCNYLYEMLNSEK